jgi:hypothetical protein
MEIKTKVGIDIEIQSEGSTKILAFNKPVRSIELSKEESSHIGSLLSIDSKTGITAELRKLKVANFFASPKSFRDIKQELQKNGTSAKSASLNTILSKMIERNELCRTGTRGAYLYQKAESFSA